MRKFAVFDIDGTVIRWQLLHSIVNELGKHSKIPAEAHRKIRDARYTWKNRTHSESFSDYEMTLVHTYHEVIKNLKSADFLEAVDTVFETYKDQVYTYTRDLIRKLKSEDYLLFAISGSQQEIIQKLADYYGFDAVAGSRYEQKAGIFTGERSTPYGNKHLVLRDFVSAYGANKRGSIAVGDSLSDVSMLAEVEQPIAFNPNKQLFDHAKGQGWKIVVERKNMIYELEKGNGNTYFLA